MEAAPNTSGNDLKKRQANVEARFVGGIYPAQLPEVLSPRMPPPAITPPQTQTLDGSSKSIEFVTVIVPLTRLPESVIKSANPHIALPLALPQLHSAHFPDSAEISQSAFVPATPVPHRRLRDSLHETITSAQKDIFAPSQTTPHQSKDDEQPLIKKIPPSQPSRKWKGRYKRLLCVFCGKVFGKNRTFFKDHIRSHIHEVAFECPDCGKEYSKQDSYKRHVKRYCRVRNKEKGHSCPVCQESLRTKFNLQLHLKRHSNPDKIHRCSRCPATFKTWTGLRTHKKIKHEGNVGNSSLTRPPSANI